MVNHLMFKNHIRQNIYDMYHQFKVAPFASVACLMNITLGPLSVGGSGSGSILTGRHDGYPSIIRACLSAPRPMGLSSTTFINRLQIISNKRAKVPRLHR